MSDRPHQSPDPEAVLEAVAATRRLARSIAKSLGVQKEDALDDCEQAGLLAMIEVSPRHDRTRRKLFVFAWKRIAGAVTTLVCRDAPIDRAGREAAIEETTSFHDTTNPFSLDDFDVGDEQYKDQLKAYCRAMTFNRVLAETNERLKVPGADVAFVRARAFKALERVLGELSELERQVIQLRHMDELSWENVAGALGMDDGKQAERIETKLRARLRRNLRLQGVNEPPPSER